MDHAAAADLPQGKACLLERLPADALLRGLPGLALSADAYPLALVEVVLFFIAKEQQPAALFFYVP